MPYFGSDAVDAHSVPKMKFSGPIFPMAGRPYMFIISIPGFL